MTDCVDLPEIDLSWTRLTETGVESVMCFAHAQFTSLDLSGAIQARGDNVLAIQHIAAALPECR